VLISSKLDKKEEDDFLQIQYFLKTRKSRNQKYSEFHVKALQSNYRANNHKLFERTIYRSTGDNWRDTECFIFILLDLTACLFNNS